MRYSNNCLIIKCCLKAKREEIDLYKSFRSCEPKGKYLDFAANHILKWNKDKIESESERKSNTSKQEKPSAMKFPHLTSSFFVVKNELSYV